MREHDKLPGDGHRIVCHLDQLLANRQMTLTALAEQVGLTVVNVSILKNDRAKAVRFSTLTRICDVLNCQPGDVLSIATTTDHSPSRREEEPSTQASAFPPAAAGDAHSESRQGPTRR